MVTPRREFNAQSLAAGSPAYRASHASPDPKGNRAERRAWAKLTKSETPPPVSHSDTDKEAGQP